MSTPNVDEGKLNAFMKEATMNVLKAAIVGLALISGNTLVRADVITDWNNTAMDVMKAVNVGGNPWTRSMALVNVSMSDAVNWCRTDIRVTRRRSLQLTRTPRPRPRQQRLHAKFSCANIPARRRGSMQPSRRRCKPFRTTPHGLRELL